MQRSQASSVTMGLILWLGCSNNLFGTNRQQTTRPPPEKGKLHWCVVLTCAAKWLKNNRADRSTHVWHSWNVAKNRISDCEPRSTAASHLGSTALIVLTPWIVNQLPCPCWFGLSNTLPAGVACFCLRCAEPSVKQHSRGYRNAAGRRCNLTVLSNGLRAFYADQVSAADVG